jgi:hypothetical protein
MYRKINPRNFSYYSFKTGTAFSAFQDSKGYPYTLLIVNNHQPTTALIVITISAVVG